jgi:hypothetical protein
MQLIGAAKERACRPGVHAGRVFIGAAKERACKGESILGPAYWSMQRREHAAHIGACKG